MKAEKDMREVSFFSWLENFVYERNNKRSLQNDKEDKEQVNQLSNKLVKLTGYLYQCGCSEQENIY